MNQVGIINTLQNQLEKLNANYKQILKYPTEEIILYPQIFVRKVMPKKFLSRFHSNDRYIMLTNKILYNLDSKKFDAGEYQQDLLIKNSIDVNYISHIIF